MLVVWLADGQGQANGSSNILSPSRDLLFLGVDDREGSSEFEGRTDTILIFHIGNWGQKDSLISIPRDTRVELEGHGYAKINAAYVYGGQDMVIQEIRELTGIDIDKVMMVNFDAFKSIIDILGGVTIEVTEPLHDPLSGADFEPGTYNMDGEQALSYARCRATARADLDRVGRQQQLLSELIKQKVGLATIIKAPQIIRVLSQEAVTGFSIGDYIAIGMVMFLSSEDINRLTIPTSGANIDGISYLIADPVQVREYLSQYIKLDY
ncbi:MAG: LCP family protein [Actinomycetota bacterium]|nr:LCP family protein [Actinomycetota bacterium]